MKLTAILVVLLSLAISCRALNCWICENARSNDACLRRGRLQTCQANQRACQNEVRRGSFGILVTKRCKQALACENNFIQNPRAAWFPTQCNTRTPSSVCRCCCDFDECNKPSLDCQSDTRGPVGDTCPGIGTPRHGKKECFYNSLSVQGSERYNLTTECIFNCDEGHVLIGSNASTCDLDPLTQDAVFNRPEPMCKPEEIPCPVLRAPSNGNISCTNGQNLGSICSFQCNEPEGFTLLPADRRSVTCKSNCEWDHPIPCCELTCPPNAVVDMVIVLDSSSSIGDSNWRTMTNFTKRFVNTFKLDKDFSHLSVIRYNAIVDTRSQILFNSYDNNKTQLLQAIDRIPYNGAGTNTGKALQYVNNTILLPKNGNRPNARDVVIVITDGRANDTGLLNRTSTDLRKRNVLTYAIGIVPSNGKLDEGQLKSIGGSESRVLLATGGFGDLVGIKLLNDLSSQVCESRCSDVQ